MLDNQFDDIIKKKLSGFKHNSEPDWHAFVEKRNKRLDHIGDDELDSIIKQKIHAFNPRTTPSNWTSLKERFNKIQALKGQVISVKSLELLIFLILMIPLTNRIADHHDDQGSPNQAFLDESPNKTILNNEPKNGLFYNSSELPATMDLTKDDEHTIQSSFGEVAFNTKTTDTRNNNLKADNKNNLINQDSNLEFGNENTVDLMPGSIESVVSLDAPEYAVIENNLNQIDDISFLNSSIHYLDSGDRYIAIGLSELAGSQEVNPIIISNWMSISGVIQNNIINSPVDAVYGIEAHQNYAPGYSLALSFGHLAGRFEMVGGLSYSRTSYEPYPITETYEGTNGIHVVSMKDIALESLSIPLEVRYHALVNPEWSIYLRAGLSANLLWKEDYLIEDRLDIPLPRQPGTEIDPNQALLYNKNFSYGFQGDLSFGEALYLNGHIGLGLERMISTKTKLFMSGYYSHQLSNELGPNRDKINVAGFETGVKLKF